jgi:acetate---CoA ligase (ADP-forming)
VSDVAVEALFHQTGIIRANTLDEMFDLATAMSGQPLPKGKRVAILTNAGGLRILCADTCEANGLIVQELHDSTKNPIFALPPGEGCVIIDSRIRVEPLGTQRAQPNL